VTEPGDYQVAWEVNGTVPPSISIGSGGSLGTATIIPGTTKSYFSNTFHVVAAEATKVAV
jgi:hypothetical protein